VVHAARPKPRTASSWEGSVSGVRPEPGVRREIAAVSRPDPENTATTAARAAVEPEPPVADARPELLLTGIAEDGANGAIVRTALIVAAGQLVFAKEGDRVLSRFVVLRIAADAVQLRDAERGEVFTLAFR